MESEQENLMDEVPKAPADLDTGSRMGGKKYRNLGITAIILIVLYFIVHYTRKQEGVMDWVVDFAYTVGCELLVVLCFALMLTVAVCLYYVIHSIANKETEYRKYMITSFVLLLGVLVVLKNYSYSVSDILDLIADGQFFAFLLLFVIVFSVLLLCAASIEKMILMSKSPDKGKMGKAIEEISEQSINMGKDIISAFFNLVKFITVDYLSEIQNYVSVESVAESVEKGQSNGVEEQETQAQGGFFVAEMNGSMGITEEQETNNMSAGEGTSVNKSTREENEKNSGE